jgi:hypothetical protein
MAAMLRGIERRTGGAMKLRGAAAQEQRAELKLEGVSELVRAIVGITPRERRFGWRASGVMANRRGASFRKSGLPRRSFSSCDDPFQAD